MKKIIATILFVSFFANYLCVAQTTDKQIIREHIKGKIVSLLKQKGYKTTDFSEEDYSAVSFYKIEECKYSFSVIRHTSMIFDIMIHTQFSIPCNDSILVKGIIACNNFNNKKNKYKAYCTLDKERNELDFTIQTIDYYTYKYFSLDDLLSKTIIYTNIIEEARTDLFLEIFGFGR